MLCRQLGFAIATAVLIAAAGAVPVQANDGPLTRSKPVAATAATQAPAARTAPRVQSERRATRPAASRAVSTPAVIRVAAVQRQDNCLLFFCWRNFPLIMGVGY